MADTMVKKIAGDEYNVLKLDGKPYAPVNQRVESAIKHGGYTVVSCEFKEIFEHRVCEVWIEVEGRKFCGTAEIKKNFARPLEDAQTSAIGRALGFAGFDIERAIASAEDMASLESASVTVDAEAPRQIKPAPAAPKVVHKALPEPKAKVPTVGDQCVNLAKDLHFTRSDWNALVTLHTHSDKTDWEAMKAALMAQVEEKAAS